MAGPTHLFSQGVTIQQATSGVALSALTSQFKLQQLGLETIHERMKAPFRVVNDASKTEAETERNRNREN